MDYEKLYKEALERAREELGSGCFDKGTVEYIFPELAESEDERIRKEIIKFIKVSKPEWKNYSDYSSWIAWLEKRKERSGLTKDEEFTLNRIIEHFEEEGGYDKWIEVLQDIRNIPYQKEHKPAWSEEDERLQQCLIIDQEECLEEVRNDEVGHSEIISDLKEMYHKRIDWLKSLKDRVQIQSKQQ